MDGTQTRPFVPQDPVWGGDVLEEPASSGEAGLVGAVEPDDDLVEEVHLGQHFHDAGQALAVHLGCERGDHQRHRATLTPRAEVVLEVLERSIAEIVQRGDHAVLEEVTHAAASVSPPGR